MTVWLYLSSASEATFGRISLSSSTHPRLLNSFQKQRNYLTTAEAALWAELKRAAISFGDFGKRLRTHNWQLCLLRSKEHAAQHKKLEVQYRSDFLSLLRLLNTGKHSDSKLSPRLGLL